MVPWSKTRTKDIDPTCPAFTEAIEVLGKPWTGLILGLLQGGPLRFSELEARAKSLGAKTLSARLKALEKRGILARRVDDGPPVRVEYSLTRKGRAFQHVARSIERWGRELISER